ncbi:DNA-directed_RNA polymerase subunit [Hexamita inflata]|uniref:DNA-directed RNA polymerase subunit n=1 Tax=Hexamita inflata TaxID=28002 RepID=A0AA86NDH8_9EUKA|nr:DNA-directed RNA polymerase subunit [Hexamita inflata]CAI9964248.1 DNA-directed RNA polymerase subunit [Hexamita inflata]
MLFCPNCANVLLIDKAGNTQFFCRTCPYHYELNGQVVYKLQKQDKEIKPLLAENQMFDGQKINEECPKCSHSIAYCIMFQTRSSDEPMTRFFMCEECKYRWKNDQ